MPKPVASSSNPIAFVNSPLPSAADTHDSTRVVSLCTPQSLLIIGVFPFLNVCSFTWVYTAVPLHFLDSGWPLTTLGALLSLCYAPRLLVSAGISQTGEWVCVFNGSITF